MYARTRNNESKPVLPKSRRASDGVDMPTRSFPQTSCFCSIVFVSIRDVAHHGIFLRNQILDVLIHVGEENRQHIVDSSRFMSL